MSLALAAGRMTMRADILRNSAAADRHGNPGLPGWQVREDAAPCWLYVKNVAELKDGRRVGVVEQIRGLFRWDADIKQGDKVTAVEDRRGESVFEGDLEVESVTERSAGSRVAHKEVVLRRARGGP